MSAGVPGTRLRDTLRAAEVERWEGAIGIAIGVEGGAGDDRTEARACSVRACVVRIQKWKRE